MQAKRGKKSFPRKEIHCNSVFLGEAFGCSAVYSENVNTQMNPSDHNHIVGQRVKIHSALFGVSPALSI